MEQMGFQFVPDPFNLSADAAKVIALQERHKTEGLQVVQDPVLQGEPADE